MDDLTQGEGIKTNLQIAAKLISGWLDSDRPALLQIVKDASTEWYHPIDREPIGLKVSAMTTEFAQLGAKVDEAKATEGITSNPSQGTGGPHITVAPQKTAAQLLKIENFVCLLYTSPSPRDLSTSRMPSSA